MNISMKIVSKRLIIDILLMTINFKAWRGEGLPLSTTSNEAAKMYDATLTQVSFILYTWVEKVTVRGKCLVQEHHTVRDPTVQQGLKPRA